MSTSLALTYGRYLKLDELLALQCPRSAPMVPDELLFITVHQVFELWLKLLLFELSHARDEMLSGASYAPRVRLHRCHVIERALVEQFDVLDSMEASDFVRFRTVLGTASGAQSVQFLEIEFLSGMKDFRYAECRSWLTTAEHTVLRRRLSEPSLWEAFLTVMRDASVDVSTPEQRSAAYQEIARDRESRGALWDLMEAMVAHDQSWQLWRARYALTVTRQIGTKRGTGGTYLNARVDLSFYPELWAMRTHP